MRILNNILTLLQEQNKKQKDLTDYLGISKNVFSDWKSEKNQSYKKYLPQIASFFGVSVDYLLGETDQKEKPTPKGEPGEDMVVVHRNGKRIVYHITDNNLDSILPLLETLEAKSDPDL